MGVSNISAVGCARVNSVGVRGDKKKEQDDRCDLNKVRDKSPESLQ